MVKVRYSHLKTLDPDNILAWYDTLNNSEFKELVLKHQEFYLSTLYKNDNLSPEVKATVLANSCELVEILNSLNLDSETLLASFYFPLVANGVVELKELHEQITPIMLRILKGTISMSAIDVINFTASKDKGAQIGSIRNLLLSMADDYRSIIIKLAERILFLRQLDSCKLLNPNERQVVATKCLEVYGSLANRLGIGQLKWEIEDLCFKLTNPDSYFTIVKKLNIRRLERVRIIDDFVADISEKIRTQCKISNFECYGRPKHLYSIHNKMQKKNLRFERLFDLFAARVVVDTVEQCYQVLSMINENYQTIASEFDDYIANQKPNGYQSIHTVIQLTDRFPCELQIRTHDMHNYAEVGVAAHWQYKEGKKSSNKATDKIAWLRKLLDWQKDISAEQDEETGNEIRKQLLDDRVYIFTPRGEVIDLPVGSTPLDFAYSIHTEVGHRCIGAKVNNRIVNFSYTLQTGDKVEILTQKEANISRDWVNFVKTSRAKGKILNYFSKIDRDKHIKDGQQIIETAFKNARLDLKNYQAQLLKRFKLANNYEELCINFGNGVLKAGQLTAFLESLQTNDEDKVREADNLIQERLNELNKKEDSQPKSSNNTNQIQIEGTDSVMYQLAKCCQPIPGDPIIGYITKGRGVSIHAKSCQHIQHLAKSTPDRIVECSWNANYRNANSRIRARIQVIGLDRVGMLRDISAVLSSDKVAIANFSSKLNQKTMLNTMRFEVDISDVELLNKVLLGIMQISGVVQAIRT